MRFFECFTLFPDSSPSLFVALGEQLKGMGRRIMLFEAGSAVLFFGALAQQPALHQTAANALSELSALGYRIPDSDNPVRVFPALTSGGFSGRHAGGWRPGAIYLRGQPQGAFGEGVYLRHELFHEASHRTCGGKLPPWAEEAGAMVFSGELEGEIGAVWPSDTELDALQQRIRQGAELRQKERELLGRLVSNTGWPDTPCQIPDKLQAVLGSSFADSNASGYVLLNLQSGRILESGGDRSSRFPPGSLLKLTYAAALSDANPDVLSAELAASDTERLLQRRRYFKADSYRLLLSPIKDRPPAGVFNSEQADWAVYLGSRDHTGNFPLQTNLQELALAMRAALLARPDYFKGLRTNGALPGSTLAGQTEADKKLLRQMQVMAKTGTASTATGQPLVGHLLLAWPDYHPVFLAIFRQTGSSGAAILPKAAALLRQWRTVYPPSFATVRVRLLTPTVRDSWEARSDCPQVDATTYRFTLCGQFRIVSTARGSRSERVVSGVLYADDSGPAILETDTLSYVDAVLEAEAQTLSGNALQAMRAVIAWNAAHGNHRHPESNSLCDTTHCMVFLGERPNEAHKSKEIIDIDLLRLLDELASQTGQHWLPFAAGGDERWQRQIAASELDKLFNESDILDIRRERRKNGELFVRLYYPDSEEAVTCEIFRNTLKLPSCPERIAHSVNRASWEFTGLGAGHGMGLSVARAQALANDGHSAAQILKDVYTQAIVESTPPLRQAYK